MRLGVWRRQHAGACRHTSPHGAPRPLVRARHMQTAATAAAAGRGAAACRLLRVGARGARATSPAPRAPPRACGRRCSAPAARAAAGHCGTSRQAASLRAQGVGEGVRGRRGVLVGGWVALGEVVAPLQRVAYGRPEGACCCKALAWRAATQRRRDQAPLLGVPPTLAGACAFAGAPGGAARACGAHLAGLEAGPLRRRCWDSVGCVA